MIIQLTRAVDELNRRLEVIERLMLPQPTRTTEPETPTPVATEPPRELTLDPVAPVEPVAVTPTTRAAKIEKLKAIATPPTPTPTPTRTPPTRTPPRPAPPVIRRKPVAARPKRRLEDLIGGRLAAWVGAVAVLLGVGFGIVHYGTDVWGQLSTAAKCLLIAGFGGLLLGAGELALRKVGHAASLGLFGAGLAVLYLDSLGASTIVAAPVVSIHTSFLLMAIVAAIGLAISLRTQFRAIAALSLVGGFLAPIFLGGQPGYEVELLMYLTALAAVGLILAVVRPAIFRPLRWLVLVALLIVGGVWMMVNGTSNVMLSACAAGVWWAMFIGEAVIGAHRTDGRRGNVTMSLIVGAAFVSAGCLVLSGAGADQWLGLFTAAIGALAISTAVMIGDGWETLRGPVRSPLRKLALALWLQGGVLAVVAIGLQFDGVGLAAGWILLGLASVELGRRLPSRGVTIFGLITGALGGFYVWAVSWALHGWLTDDLWTGGPFTITTWSLLALGALAASAIAAVRVDPHRSRIPRAIPVIVGAIAVTQWLPLSLLVASDHASTWLWTAGAVAVVTMRRRLWVGALTMGFAVLALTAVKWVMVDFWLMPSFDHYAPRPFLNGIFLAGVGLTAAFGWTWFLLRNDERSERGTDTGALSHALLWLVPMAAIGFEIHHAFGAMALAPELRVVRESLALTALVAAVGAAMVIVHRVGSAGMMAGLGRVLTGIAAVAFVGWDLFGLYPLIRDLDMGSMLYERLGVGALVVAAATVAARLRRDGGSRREAFEFELAAWFAGLLALSFEVESILTHANAALITIVLAITGVWTIGAVAMMFIRRRVVTHPTPVTGLGLLATATLAWLTYETIGWRLAESVAPGPVLLNLQTAIGTLLAAGWLATRRWWRDVAFEGLTAATTIAPAAILLWIGSLEIDRAFSGVMATQTGLTIFWALYGTALVVLGVWRSLPVARYAGLGLLAVTLSKFVLYDLAGVDIAYKFLSALGVGLLLIGVSVIYGRREKDLGVTGSSDMES